MTPDQADRIIRLLEEIRDRLPEPERARTSGPGALPRSVRVSNPIGDFQF